VVQLYLHNTADYNQETNCTRPQHNYPVCMYMQHRKPCINCRIVALHCQFLVARPFCNLLVLAASGAETVTTMHWITTWNHHKLNCLRLASRSNLYSLLWSTKTSLNLAANTLDQQTMQIWLGSPQSQHAAKQEKQKCIIHHFVLLGHRRTS